MEKINFENYPSTDYPINADNLNKLQNNVEDAIMDNIITATFSSNYTITTTATYEILPLDTSIENNSIFTLQNYKIVIPAGVNKVKVSYKTHFNSLGGTLQAKWCVLFVNDTTTCAVCQTLSARATLSSPTQIIEVSEGDVLDLRVYGDAGDVIRSTSVYTTLTVEEVK